MSTATPWRTWRSTCASGATRSARSTAGIPPTDRKKIQMDFRLNKQICIATEAAGEGINLQFCHRMVNYDLPWNPVRLRQRRGRVHRISQEHDCYIFNFSATHTGDGPLLEPLHPHPGPMPTTLQGR